MATKIVSVSDLKARLSALLAQLQAEGAPVYVIQHGKPKAVLVKYEEYEALLEKVEDLEDVRITVRSGDQGIDGTCTIPFLKLTCAFQAKRFGPNNPVGGPAVRNFKGGVVGRYDRGIFITTSTFTVGAIEEAEQPGVSTILIDGKELVAEMTKLALGVKTVPVVEKLIDEDFFDNLGR